VALEDTAAIVEDSIRLEEVGVTAAWTDAAADEAAELADAISEDEEPTTEDD
jgi:hypothetical protein